MGGIASVKAGPGRSLAPSGGTEAGAARAQCFKHIRAPSWVGGLAAGPCGSRQESWALGRGVGRGGGEAHLQVLTPHSVLG